MAKPDSMKKFDLFFWGSMAFSIIGMALGWGAIEEVMASEEMGATQAALGEGALQTITAIGLVVGLLIYVALWFLISVKRIEFIKWIYIALVAYGLIQLPASFELVGGFGAMHIPGVISTVLSLLAIWMTFRPDSREWFAARNEGKRRDEFKSGVDLK